MSQQKRERKLRTSKWALNREAFIWSVLYQKLYFMFVCSLWGKVLHTFGLDVFVESEEFSGSLEEFSVPRVFGQLSCHQCPLTWGQGVREGGEGGREGEGKKGGKQAMESSNNKYFCTTFIPSTHTITDHSVLSLAPAF